MTIIKSFLAGFFSTLIFHQGLIALIKLFETIPAVPFNMNPTKPLGVPSVISLAFFGGLWGIFIWTLLKKKSARGQLIGSIILGALLPTLVVYTVVLPLKGIEINLHNIPFGLLVNGTWGLGLWLIMKFFSLLKTASSHAKV